MVQLLIPNFTKIEETNLDKLIAIADELNDWEYRFVMDIAERGSPVGKQIEFIDKMVYEKIEIYL